jgi:S-adenosylmethionine:tRNA-ribosyltransferase-isomerase (queuine synthetase)
MRAYDEALRAGYRFLSFGDAMLIERGLEPPMDEDERR